MADNRVQVDIVAENAQLRAKLAESEALLAQTGQRGGKEAARGIDEATKAAGAFSRVLRLIAIPTIAWEAASRAADWIFSQTERTKTLRKEVDDLAQAYLDAAKSAGIKTQLGDRASETAKQRAEEREIENSIGAKRDALAEIRRKEQAISDEFWRARNPRTDAQGRGDDARKNIKAIDEQLKILDEKIAAVRQARDKLAEASAEQDNAPLRATIASQKASLETDPELRAKMELEEQKRQIELKYHASTNLELAESTKALVAETLKNLDALYEQSAKRRAAAIQRQSEEILRSIQRAQTSGFGLNGGGPPSLAGTGTALQFLTDNIASFARTQGGGR